MLDSTTLFYTSFTVVFVMVITTFVIWRANRHFRGVGLYVVYAISLLLVMAALLLRSVYGDQIAVTLATVIFTLTSILHVYAVSQFVNYQGLMTRIFALFTVLLLIGFNYYLLINNNLRTRIFVSDIQHTLEALSIIYIVISHGWKKYPNASAVYLLSATLCLVIFSARTIWLGSIESYTGTNERWFSATLLIIGVVAPMLNTIAIALFCNERREKNLNTLREKAQRDLELRSVFLSTISHEIRTPLNGIMGSAQLIMNQNSISQSKPYCEAIIHSTESLNLLIDKVLEFAHLDQSDAALYEEDIELKPWIDNLCLLMSPLAEQKNIEFELNCHLPEHACYYFDHQKLRQVLINLVGNAIKFTDKGKVSLQVHVVRDGQEAHTLRFSVIDTGPGIEKDEIDRLTEPYVQSYAGKKKGGSGLGLAITSRLLAHLSSQLNIDSEQGKGSTFSFDLRLALGELSLVESRHQSSEYLTGLNVLLVEDLALNQKIAIEFMAEDEHRVKLASTGQEAVDLLVKYHFDVVLLDMNLPDFNGQEVLTRIRQMEHRNNRTPFLAFTASLSPDEVKEYLALGIKDIVGKPIKQAKLRQALSDSQSNKTGSISADLEDILYDETAFEMMSNTFEKEELDTIYNEFILSARDKMVRAQQLLTTDKEQCMKLLHRQASTALQLGFNRYGLALKNVERRLVDGISVDNHIAQCLDLWQESLSEYLKTEQQCLQS